MPDRPQPRFPEPDTEAFWEATRERKLTYQIDPATGQVVFFPRRHSPYTGSSALEVRESKGLGTVDRGPSDQLGEGNIRLIFLDAFDFFQHRELPVGGQAVGTNAYFGSLIKPILIMG